MIQSQTFDLEDIRQNKIKFFTTWVLSNAAGMSLGWCLGEYFGQLMLKEYGVRVGIFVAALVFELALWVARLVPAQYFSQERPLKFLDVTIWLSTELFGWVVFSFMEAHSSYLTLEVIFITSMGVTFWIIVAIFGLLRNRGNQKPQAWFLKAFLYVLIGFLLGNAVIALLTTTARSIGDYIGEVFDPYTGMGAAGLFLGGAFGIITGVILVQSINWTRRYKLEHYN